MRVVLMLQSPVGAFEPSDEQLRALAARLPGHDLVPVRTSAQLTAELGEAEAAVVWEFRREWYALAPRLRHLFTPAAGRELLAPDPARVVQLHFGQFHGTLMAESLLAMISFMNRRLGAALGAQGARRWDRSPFSSCRRLRGQVVALLGYGAIGQRCGELLSAVGMVVHGVRRDLSRPSPWAARLFSAEQRLEAVRLADHVVCALPGDTGTDHLLDAEVLAHMKPSACVYNIGRGNAIDPDALRAALQQRRIAGAFLDVVPEEPLPPASPLWATPGLYLTPHAAAISAEYLDLYFDELARELVAVR